MARPDIPYIDQRMFRPGMILHARTKGFFGRAIRWAQSKQAKREGLPKPWGNHDALMWYECGAWYVLDAEPPVAHPTPWTAYERRMRAGKVQTRFYWPSGAMQMDGNVAVKWWLRHVNNSPYDKWAFPRLLWRAVLGPRWKSQAGKPHAWWCTESVRGGWSFAGFDVWKHNNSTPLDTEEAVGVGGLDDYSECVLGLIETN